MKRRVELLVAVVLLVGCASEPLPAAAPENEPVVATTPTPETTLRVELTPSLEPAAVAAIPKWAFAEYRQNGTDTSETVELLRDGTYRWRYGGGGILADGVRLIDHEELGRWRVAHGWIEFEPERRLAHQAESSRRLSSRGVVACWRGQRAFLPENAIVAFANVLNRGNRLLELSRRFLLAKTPAGATYPESEFTLPPEYADYVLPEPVIATLLTVVDRRALGESGDRVEFTLDRGAADGLRVRHELWTLDLPSADEIPWSGRLVEVGEHTSRGRMRYTNFVPAVGGRMSTRDPRSR